MFTRLIALLLALVLILPLSMALAFVATIQALAILPVAVTCKSYSIELEGTADRIMWPVMALIG